MEVIDVFFLQLQASSGEGAFVSVLFSLLTVAFSSHHLPHVAPADNRLHRRGEESDERQARETLRCDEKGKAPGETQKNREADRGTDSEMIEGRETGSQTAGISNILPNRATNMRVNV